MIDEAETRLAKLRGHLADLDAPAAAGAQTDPVPEGPNA
jgi:hypothetical protein